MYMEPQVNDKVYDLYYNEVGRHSILTQAEEKELLRRYHCCPLCSRRIPARVRATNCPTCGAIAPDDPQGREFVCTCCTKNFAAVVTTEICLSCGSPRDNEARQALIEANLRFVIRRAKKFTQDPEVLHTLISAGNIGLMQAVDRFNIDTSHRFLTYAEWWIRKEIMDELNRSNMIHVPTHKQKKLRRMNKEGPYACVHCGLRTDNERNIRHLSPCSDADGHVFEVPLQRDSQILSDTLNIDDTVCVATDNVENQYSVSEMKNVLRTTVASMGLSERDKFIVVGYFDAVSADRKSDPKKLPQLAAVTGITPERVRQVKEKLLEQLKKELKRAEISNLATLLPEDL